MTAVTLVELAVKFLGYAAGVMLTLAAISIAVLFCAYLSFCEMVDAFERSERR